MSNLFQIGALDACGGLLPVVKVIKAVIRLIQWVIPIGLIYNCDGFYIFYGFHIVFFCRRCYFSIMTGTILSRK